MADEDWPGRTDDDDGLCVALREGYTQSIVPNVRRTEFEDGSIAQRIARSRDVMIRTFTILVKDEDLPNMLDWLRDHGNDYFNFTDLDSETRECRVRGGAGAVQFQAVAGATFGPAIVDGTESEPSRYHRATVELEGYL